MPWFTVPNFFPDYQDVSGTDRYHLCEGYGISEWRSKPSGSHYKKVWFTDKQKLHTALNYLGIGRWWERYQLKRALFWRRWVLK